jgi:GT2 family glycosyltransferase
MLEGPETQSRTTVIVVPRESFAHSERSLQSLYEDPGAPFDLLYVDGGMPSPLRRTIERDARARGFRIVNAGRHVTPNRARNAGLLRATTEFTVIVDNDIIFAPKWLATMIACADETQADVVGPLICIGDPPFRRVHSAGGDASVDGPAGAKRFREIHRFIDYPLTPALRSELIREAVGLVEFHCMLVRRSIFERVGLLDEQLRSAAEHSDFCISVRAAGGRIVFEPQAAVNQLLPLPFPHDVASLPFFLSRWSEERNRASLARLCAKYAIAADDPGIRGYAGWLAERRQLMFAHFLRPLRASPLLRPLFRLRLACKHQFRSLVARLP